MSIQPEEYVSLNQPDFENPSPVSFLHDKFEFLKRRIQNVGIGVCGTTLLIFDIVQLLMGIILVKECDEDKYTPAYFIIAGIIGSGTIIAGLLIQARKYNAKITQLIYPFYVFKIFWLLFGGFTTTSELKQKIQSTNLFILKGIPCAFRMLLGYIFQRPNISWLKNNALQNLGKPGTYYFIIAKKNGSGCITAAYTLSYWLIVSHYVCFQLCILIFIWALSIIFVLVYFKNAAIRHLAKSVSFEN